jgi:hypothetical protein
MFRDFRALIVLATLATASTAFADVRVTMHDGRVTVVARDATLRQIFIEWARVGQTKVVNVERIPGGPISIELTDVPEAQALDILLRSVSGYMAAPRPTPAANLSRYDRILVMPTLVATRTANTPATPAFQQPEAAADDQPPANGAVPGRGPVFTFPQPQAVNPPPQSGAPVVVPGIGGAIPAPIVPVTTVPALYPGAPTTTSSAPTAAPGGSSVPGMIIPAPPPTVQPGQPQQR